jgi:hypothetical protein
VSKAWAKTWADDAGRGFSPTVSLSHSDPGGRAEQGLNKAASLKVIKNATKLAFFSFRLICFGMRKEFRGRIKNFH